MKIVKMRQHSHDSGHWALTTYRMGLIYPCLWRLYLRHPVRCFGHRFRRRTAA